MESKDRLLLFLLVVQVNLLPSRAHEPSEALESGLREEDSVGRLGQLSDSRRRLSDLRRAVQDLSEDTRDSRKRACSLGGGMSQHCASAFVDQQLRIRDRLRSGLGPGKRAGIVALGPPSKQTGAEALGPGWRENPAHGPGSRAEGEVSLRPEKPEKPHGDAEEDRHRDEDGVSGSTESDESHRAGLQDYLRRLRALNTLRSTLDNMDAHLADEQKRACRLNLGAHCSTQSAAYVSDQWHYLNSAHSPGRKRGDPAPTPSKRLSAKQLHDASKSTDEK